MDRGAWRATVHGVTKSQTWISDLTLSRTYESITPVLLENPLGMIPLNSSRGSFMLKHPRNKDCKGHL